jgi:excinuclease ABC subunit B
MGRAARHIEGHVIMYADNITRSMREAIDETERRRKVQETYNSEHNITPQGIKKTIKDINDRIKVVAETKEKYTARPAGRDEILRLIKELESQMKKAAKNLEFEKAALIRDEIVELRKNMELIAPTIAK